jgi:hypothetical protein
LAGYSSPHKDLLEFIKGGGSFDRVMDAVELAFRYVERILGKWSKDDRRRYGIELGSDEAIEELNERFLEHSIGYQFADGIILRVDSKFAHSEIVRPALALLSDDRFAVPQSEYLKAHEHYRAGEHREAVTAANAAFESTMKVICDALGWAYDKRARASDLVKVLRKNGLFPDYLERSFDQLAATLQSGLPEVRNEDSSAHGLGPNKRPTPPYVAAYALHLAASKIILMVDALHEREARVE